MDFEIFKLHHRGQDCLGVRLSREDSRNAQVRSIPGIKWSQTNRCWYAGFSVALEDSLQLVFGERSAAAAVGSGSRQEDAAAVGSGRRQVVDEAAAVGSGSRQEGEEGAAVGSSSRQVVEDAAAVGSSSVQEVEAAANEPGGLDASALEAVAKFKQHLQVIRHSENTIKNYTNAIIEFLKFFKDDDWEDLDEGDMERFQKERIIDRNLSYSYQNTMVSAIKKFYEVNTGKSVNPDFIKRPRKGHPIPNIFSLEQVARLLKSVKNQKHRMMLSVGYGCGLRSGEVVKLKPEDIHTDQGMLAVRKSKGNKDRMVPISANLISQLREYFKIYRPKVWLFEGEKEGEHYSQRSLQMVFRRAVALNRFPEKHKFHDLRHSYATHMMDAGTNQHVIQKILGHQNIKTTEIYTHVSKTLLQRVYNPFDNLNM